MSYDNNLTGVLFKNDRKEKDTHPDYKGSCEVAGVQYWLAGWIKEGQRGKFMSLKLTEKDEQVGPKKDPPKREPKDDGDIPW